MTFISRNVELGAPLRLSSWRKVAIGTWKTAGDPSVYGILSLDAEPALAYIEKLRARTGRRITITHFVGKALAETLKRHPDVNCILRFGKLYPRTKIDLFFQVASDDTGEDLSGMTVREADRKSMAGIAGEMEDRVRAIREKRDATYVKVKRTMGMLPGMLTGLMLDLVGFITYTLNLWSPILGSPRDPFGSVMITNVGSLGLESAFAPLVPYSRVPLLVAVGATRDTPVVREGRIVAGKVIQLCVTFDHRLIDGVHAGHMSATMKKIFADPERELGASEQN